MRLAMSDESLVQFAILYRDPEFETGYQASPKIGILNESDLEKEMYNVKNRSERYQDGYYLGICFKNKASKLHKLGMKKLKLSTKK